MFCSNCGSNIDTNSSYCPNCGSPIGKGSSDNKSYSNNSNYNSYNSNNFSKSSSYSYNNNDYAVNQLRTYVKVLAIVQIVIGVLVLFISIVFFTLENYIMTLINANMKYQMYQQSYGLDSVFIEQIIFFFAVILLFLGIFILISGIGLLKNKKWSRVTTFIISILSLFSFPLGTIFGIAAIYVLTRAKISDVLVN